MGKGGRTQTVTTQSAQTPDPASQAYINRVRQQALGAADVATNTPGSLFTGPITPDQIQAAMNPYLANVVDATKGQYDQLRSQAQLATDQQATQAGAFGGSRAAVAEGARLGQLDQGQAQTIANLLQGGYGQAQQFAQAQQQLQQQKALEPLFRQQQGLQFLNMGMGPLSYSGTSSTTQPNNKSALGGAAGGALTGASIGSIIPGIGTGIGAAIGGGLGLLGIL